MTISTDSFLGFDAVSGSNLNGGWAKKTAGTDYSQATSPILTVADGVTDGTTALTSATGGFTSDMVDNGMYLSTGGGTFREAVAFVDINEVTMDAVVAADTGITVNVGGAFALPTTAIYNMFADGGSTEGFIKSGTYTHTANLAPTGSGTYATKLKQLKGFVTTRGDACIDDDRPLLAFGSNLFYLKFESYWGIENLRITSSNATAAIISPGFTKINNVKVTQTSTGYGFFNQSRDNTKYIGCEADGSSTGAIGFKALAAETYINCHSHDFTTCIDLGGADYTEVIDTIVADGTTGISGSNSVNSETTLKGITAYTCTTGVKHNGGMMTLHDSIIDTCTTGVDHGANEMPIDFCNFNGNTADLSGAGTTVLGPFCTAIASSFEDPSSGLYFPGGLSANTSPATASSYVFGAVQAGVGGGGGGGTQIAYVGR